MAAPTAAPPGTVLDTALDASWAVPATNHDTWGRAVRVRRHWHTKLPHSSTTVATNHTGLSSRSLGISPKTLSSWGSRP